MEKKRETRLATGKTTIEQTDTRNNEPDEESADHEVNVVELIAGVLKVDINLKGVTSLGLGRVVSGYRV